ncbi:PLD nuclease N-terminal domain-containing protein [Bacillus sp. FJAT-49736]|uniref:PLD nuclease N-terminal domain-containing protein n=1 Tax=Bacillus sp. FJAT-49736 TaxID=2833582 RepID=UPI001BC9530F|nr:PLD nuclease N-terminal domain-containing protein [Bacillus sp. FJAT-49736]MBS4174836.1 PLDc_N domain-containing protein [Bacillus sp. FJAT-49736]MBS4175507.1 PLDc_N domain-containing protein [Bacillus sp. FJAT-49736]
MENINWGLIAPIVVIQVLLMVIALVDIIRIDRTKGPKWLWALIVIFINLLGPILYFVIGRKQK